MRSRTVLMTLLGLLSAASAHMHLSDPPAFRGKENKNVPTQSVDSNIDAPLLGDGSNFPCKGYQVDIGTPLGASVADWSAGSSQSYSIAGGAFHSGGSCQVSLSYDKAKTFTVIHSYIGNCPTSAGGTFPFTVPADAPSGAALFAWTWFNNVGNREMYMDCASVTIKGSGSKKRQSASFSSRPSILVANLGNGCSTVETHDVTFPNPGPDVTDTSKSEAPLVGQCQPVAGIGGGSPSGGSAPASASPVNSASSASTMVPANSPAAQGTTSAMAPSSTPTAQGGSSPSGSSPSGSSPSGSSPSGSSPSGSSPSGSSPSGSSPSGSSPSGSSPSGSPPSADGSCGSQASCIGSIHGSCCSEYGWCGSTPDYCGTGCQSAFGTCGSGNSTTGSSSLQISTDKTCGPTTTNTCQGSSYGSCCSQFGYCGSTSDYCGTGCQSGFGTCGSASGSSDNSSSFSAAVTSSANPMQSIPSTLLTVATFITVASALSSASAVTVIPVGY